MSDRVIYRGKEISKEGFRAWVYGYNNDSKIANSWDEYEALVASGLWFSTKDSVPKSPEKPKYASMQKGEQKKGGK